MSRCDLQPLIRDSIISLKWTLPLICNPVVLIRKIEEDKAIQEIRVTKKQKTERVEREVTPLPLKKDPNTQTDKVNWLFQIHNTDILH